MKKTRIEWCDSSWNPVTGCLHDCEYCYARRIATRFGGASHTTNNECARECQWMTEDDGRLHDLNVQIFDEDRSQKAPYPFGFSPTMHRYRLGDPARWKKPRTIFVCSMADLFGSWVPDAWINAVFAACRAAPQHRYLFLTKNYMRACEFPFEDNWWIGRTITHDEPCLIKNPNRDKNLYLCYGVPKSSGSIWGAHHNRFLSCEPLHGPIPDIPYYAHENGYQWVIIGGETGNRKDKVVPKREWISEIVEACAQRKVPVFMKDSLIPVVGEENMRREFPWDVQG